MYNYIKLCQKPTLYIHMEIDSLASRMSSTALAEVIWRDNWTKFVSRAGTSSTGSIAVAEKGEQALRSWDCSSRPAMQAGNYEARRKLGMGVLHLDIWVNNLLSEIQGNWYELAQLCVGLVHGPCNRIIKFLASFWNLVHFGIALSPLRFPGWLSSHLAQMECSDSWWRMETLVG